MYFITWRECVVQFSVILADAFLNWVYMISNYNRFNVNTPRRSMILRVSRRVDEMLPSLTLCAGIPEEDVEGDDHVLTGQTLLLLSNPTWASS